jgi:hypothetical protein
MTNRQIGLPADCMRNGTAFSILPSTCTSKTNQLSNAHAVMVRKSTRRRFCQWSGHVTNHSIEIGTLLIGLVDVAAFRSPRFSDDALSRVSYRAETKLQRPRRRRGGRRPVRELSQARGCSPAIKRVSQPLANLPESH